MKTRTTLLLILLATAAAIAQRRPADNGLSLGANASYLHPTGDMGKILKPGLGGNFDLKYRVNRVIGVGFETGYHTFKSTIGNAAYASADQSYKARLIPLLLQATFYIPSWRTTPLPYLGLHFGAYAHHIRIAQDRNDGYYDTSLSKSLFRFSPGGGIHAGVLFQLASDRCWLDLRLRADYAPKIRSQYDIDDYTTGNIGFDRMLLPGINIGLLYRF